MKSTKIWICLLVALVLSAATALAQASLTLQSLDGRTVDLSEGRGRVVVLAFGATWTPLAAKELPAFQQLADRYAGRDATFYWVSVNSAKQGARHYASDADLRAFAARAGLKVTVLRDPDQAVYRALGSTGLPAVVVLDKTGQVAYRHIGFDPDRAIGFGDLEKRIDALLK